MNTSVNPPSCGVLVSLIQYIENYSWCSTEFHLVSTESIASCCSVDGLLQDVNPVLCRRHRPLCCPHALHLIPSLAPRIFLSLPPHHPFILHHRSASTKLLKSSGGSSATCRVSPAESGWKLVTVDLGVPSLFSLLTAGRLCTPLLLLNWVPLINTTHCNHCYLFPCAVPNCFRLPP